MLSLRVSAQSLYNHPALTLQPTWASWREAPFHMTLCLSQMVRFQITITKISFFFSSRGICSCPVKHWVWSISSSIIKAYHSSYRYGCCVNKHRGPQPYLLQLCISEGLQGGKAEINTYRQQEHWVTATVDICSSPKVGKRQGKWKTKKYYREPTDPWKLLFECIVSLSCRENIQKRNS